MKIKWVKYFLCYNCGAGPDIKGCIITYAEKYGGKKLKLCHSCLCELKALLIPKRKFLSDLIKAVKRNPKRFKTAQDAAEFMGLEAKYFGRLWKKRVGYPFADYMNITRFHLIEKMVKENSDITQQEIADKLEICVSWVWSIVKKYSKKNFRDFKKEIKTWK